MFLQLHPRRLARLKRRYPTLVCHQSLGRDERLSVYPTSERPRTHLTLWVLNEGRTGSALGFEPEQHHNASCHIVLAGGHYPIKKPIHLVHRILLESFGFWFTIHDYRSQRTHWRYRSLREEMQGATALCLRAPCKASIARCSTSQLLHWAMPNRKAS